MTIIQAVRRQAGEYLSALFARWPSKLPSVHSIVSALFGYDFFISYAHRDGVEYPEALSKALEAEPYHYKTHFDARDYLVGADIGVLTRLRLRNSRKLVVVARPVALTESTWVRREVDAFASRGREPIIIECGNIVERSLSHPAPAGSLLEWLQANQDILRLSEREYLSVPPEDTIRMLGASFRGTRVEVWRGRVVASAIALLCLLLAGAVALGIFANIERAEAVAQRDRVELELRRATALRLAAQAKAVNSFSPQRAILLAGEAVKITETTKDITPPLAVEQTLRETLATLGGTALPLYNAENWMLAVSPDSRWAVSGGRDPIAYLYDLHQMDAPPKELQHPEGAVGQVQFSKDSRWLAASSWGNELNNFNSVRLWDLASPNPSTKGRRLQSNVTTVSFNPNGLSLATGSTDGSVRVWTLAASEPTAAPRVLTHGSAVSAIAHSPDGRTLASGSGTGIKLWRDPAGDKPMPPRILPIKENEGADVLLFAPDGKKLIASHSDRDTVTIWTLDQAEPTARLLPMLGRRPVLSPDGRWLIRPGRDSFTVVDLHSLEVGKVTQTVTGNIGEVSAEFSPDGRWVVTFGAGHVPSFSLAGYRGEERPDNRAILWSLREPNPFQTPIPLDHGSTVRAAAFSPDGKALITLTAAGPLRRWRLDMIQLDQNRKGSESSRSPTPHDLFDFIPQTGWVQSIAMTPDSRKLLVAPSGEPVRVYDLNSLGFVASPIVLDRSRQGLAESKSIGRWLAFRDGRDVNLIDMSCRDPVTCIQKFSAKDRIDSFDVTDRWIAMARERSLQLVRWKTGAQSPSTLDIDGAPRPIGSLLLSPDQNWLLVLTKPSVDYKAVPPRLYSLARLEAGQVEPIYLSGHADHVETATFSPDGRRLITTSNDAARLWDMTAQPPALIPTDLNVGVPMTPVFTERGQLVVGGSTKSIDGESRFRILTLDALGMKPESVLEFSSTAPVKWASISRSGRFVLGTGGQQGVYLWDLKAGNGVPRERKLREPPAPQSYFWKTIFSPDDRWLLSFASEEPAWLWNIADLDSNSRPIVLASDRGRVTAASFSPDSRRLVIGNSEGGLNILDMTRPRPEESTVPLSTTIPNDFFSQLNKRISAIYFAGEGAWFITESNDTKAWHAGTKALLRAAAATAGRTLTPEEVRQYGVPRWSRLSEQNFRKWMLQN